MTRMERATATRALSLPRRLTMRRTRGGMARGAFQVGVAFAGAAAAGDGPGLDGARAQLRPRHQVRGGGESGHVQPDLSDDHLGVVFAEAGDLVEPLDGTELRALGLSGRIDPTRWLRPGIGSVTRAGCVG